MVGNPLVQEQDRRELAEKEKQEAKRMAEAAQKEAWLPCDLAAANATANCSDNFLASSRGTAWANWANDVGVDWRASVHVLLQFPRLRMVSHFNATRDHVFHGIEVVEIGDENIPHVFRVTRMDNHDFFTAARLDAKKIRM